MRLHHLPFNHYIWYLMSHPCNSNLTTIAIVITYSLTPSILFKVFHSLVRVFQLIPIDPIRSTLRYGYLD